MEKRMIKRILKKDPKGLDYIMNTYMKKVYFLVDKIIGFYGKEEVEECVSDVFLAIWEDINQYDESKGSFSSFVFMKTKYKALDYKRKLENKSEKYNILEETVPDNMSTEDIVLDKENVVHSHRELTMEDKCEINFWEPFIEPMPSKFTFLQSDENQYIKFDILSLKPTYDGIRRICRQRKFHSLNINLNERLMESANSLLKDYEKYD